MASVCCDDGGLKRIGFKGLDGKRHSVRLGKRSEKYANDVRRHVEAILSAAGARLPLDQQTAVWLAEIDDELHSRLASAGLVNPREKAAAQLLGAFAECYVSSRVDAKDSSRIVYNRARRLLVEYFGAERSLGTITEGDACEWRLWLIGKPMADTTVRKMCSVARMIFKNAVKRRLIDANPFDDDEIKTAVKGNAARFQFITAETVKAVIEACPNVEWRVIVALSRWGGYVARLKRCL